MPKGSDTMTEGKVLKWVKKEGDQVSTGETVVEIETDKVDMEVEAMGSGVLRKILVQAGKVVPVGELLALIAKPNEDISSLVKGEGAAGAQPPAGTAVPALAPVPTAPPHPPASASPAADMAPRQVGAAAPTTGGATPPAPEPAIGGRVLASPLARRMAQEAGLDLNRIAGSGPAGRIVRQDVERAAVLLNVARASRPPWRERPAPARGHDARATAGETPAPQELPTLAKRPAPAPTGPEFYDEPLSSMRKVIATRLVQSKAPVPHFYLTIEVDMGRAKELRESAKALNPELSLSYNDIILKACAAALQLHPQVNASFQGEAIRYYRRIHLGVAVAVEDGGLITPVIRNCEGKSLQDISREAKDLIARARSRKLNPDEYTGATFSVSNLGMMGIEEFSAVINPPEGAILAVGAVAEKPVAVKGQVEVGLCCRMTLSCDHRVVDGATGAMFLHTLKQILENPVYLAF
jgi:pyruvate dehydrogenase E2 component (dihydrolipoamide acetyltransferase)